MKEGEVMKHVVITGSSRGIGYGLAERFLQLGCRVTINGTTEDGVKNGLNALKNKYPNAYVQGFKGNVVNTEEVEMIWNSATETFGDIDIWINNAGIGGGQKLFWQQHSKEVKNIIDINILGLLNGSHVALNKMIKQGHGQIYNMEGFGSDGMMMKRMTLYGTTKRAVRYFTRSLAKEVEGSSIIIGSISPGMVLTDLLLDSLNENKEEREKNKRIFNILADRVETVSSFLTKEILNNKKNNAKIIWLTKHKMLFRFMTYPLTKRNIID